MQASSLQKNVLDLEYGKNAQLYTTGIVIFSTYFVGVIIAFMTKQLDYGNRAHIFTALIISLPFLFGSFFLMMNAKKRMKGIRQSILSLEN